MKPLTQEQKVASARLNEKQRALANLVLEKADHGMTNGECHQKCGYRKLSKEAASVAAGGVLSNNKVKRYLSAMRAAVVQATTTTVESLVVELEEARTVAKDERVPGAMVSATMGKAKILGLEKTVITGADGGPVKISVSDMTDEEIEAKLKEYGITDTCT